MELDDDVLALSELLLETLMLGAQGLESASGLLTRLVRVRVRD